MTSSLCNVNVVTPSNLSADDNSVSDDDNSLFDDGDNSLSRLRNSSYCSDDDLPSSKRARVEE